MAKLTAMTNGGAVGTNGSLSLVERARGGERVAFQTLVAQASPKASSIVRRMVGHPEDSEDIIQEATLRAWQGLASFQGEAQFSTWFVAIAARSAVDFLRRNRRWRTEAQVAFANLCAETEELATEVGNVFARPDFSFEVREHIAYCFACVGRSLPPDEQAALVLRDVCQMSSREAAAALGISLSVLGHRLSAARQTMTEKYESLCALVNKAGICHQCAGLRAAAPDAKRGGPLPDIAEFADRIDSIRKVDPQTGRTRLLHELFWRRTADVERVGAGSTTPGDCMTDP